MCRASRPLCLFKHSERQIVISVHGGDFAAAGPKVDLDLYEAEMNKHYELTTQPRLGPAPQGGKGAAVLNRIIRWCDHGLEYEVGPRQVEKLFAECDWQVPTRSPLPQYASASARSRRIPTFRRSE